MTQNNVLNKILIGIICSLVLFITVMTAISFATKKSGKKDSNITTVEPSVKEITSLNKRSDQSLASYTGIGRIRILTKGIDELNIGTPLVIEPWFTYDESNFELYEELSKKRILLTGLISNYFSSKTKQEIVSMSEEKIKADLLNELNSHLVLGKILQIYFTDYIFLE